MADGDEEKARGVHPSAARCPELTELSGAELRQVLQLVGFDFDGHDRGKPKLKWPWANQAKAANAGAPRSARVREVLVFISLPPQTLLLWHHLQIGADPGTTCRASWREPR